MGQKNKIFKKQVSTTPMGQSVGGSEGKGISRYPMPRWAKEKKKNKKQVSAAPMGE